MIIQYPIAYSEQVVPKRARKVREEQFGEFINVEIQEVTKEAAPIAFDWEDETIKGGLAERRWFENKLWEPLCTSFARKQAVPISLNEYADERGRLLPSTPVATNQSWAIRDLYNRCLPSLSFDSYKYRSVLTDNRASQLERLAALAKETLIIDGEIWVEASEPVYEIGQTSFFTHHNSTFVNVTNVNSIKDDKCIYRADRFEDALDAIDAYLPLPRGSITEINVYIPEAVTYETETKALVRGVEETKGMLSSEVVVMPTQAAIAWFGVRDALNDYYSQPDEKSLEALLSAAESLSEYADEDSYTMTPLMSSLDRWKNRSLPLSFDDDGGTFSP